MRNMEEEKERYEIIRKHVHAKLQESGDLDRLRCYVRRRLVATGWKWDMLNELRVAANEHGDCNISVENLHDKIAISGRKLDDRVTEEAVKKIKYCYKEALSGGDRKEVEREPDDSAKEEIRNFRYISEHRD